MALFLLAMMALAVSGWAHLLLLSAFLQVPARPVPVHMALQTLLISSEGALVGRLSRWVTERASRSAAWLGSALILAVVLPQVSDPDPEQLRVSVYVAGSLALGLSGLVVLALTGLWWTRIVHGLHPVGAIRRVYLACAGIVLLSCVAQTLTIPAQAWLGAWS